MMNVEGMAEIPVGSEPQSCIAPVPFGAGQNHGQKIVKHWMQEAFDIRHSCFAFLGHWVFRHSPLPGATTRLKTGMRFGFDLDVSIPHFQLASPVVG